MLVNELGCEHFIALAWVWKHKREPKKHWLRHIMKTSFSQALLRFMLCGHSNWVVA